MRMNRSNDINRIEKISDRIAALPHVVPFVPHEVGVGQYKTLNDAYYVTNDRGYLKGSTEIWYMKPDFFRDGISGYNWLVGKNLLPIRANTGLTHIWLGSIAEHSLGKIFNMMQGESWSPNGQANSLIRSRRLQHTSMSVGDIVKIGGKVLLVDSVGFKELD